MKSGTEVSGDAPAATGAIRQREYPSLSKTTYLDHSGTTLYAKSLIEAYTADLTNNLFGNPHSASPSSQLSSQRIDDTRVQVLRFFNASPEDFDVVFVANATAALKLVADAFRDHDSGFWYGYHVDSHTSLVGVRELASQGSRCFKNDQEVEDWLGQLEAAVPESSTELQLFAYPGQSNMTGHRLPLSWCQRFREPRNSAKRRVYTLYDAAALLSTSPLDLSDTSSAPDFIALSFYKIFGFPDLGALMVRKDSGDILRQRKYFGGGTVDMITTLDQQWHAKKATSLHKCLEDGTLPFHNIVALQSALTTHARLYGTMSNISRHCNFLTSRAHSALSSLRHSNGTPVCKLYPSSNTATSTPVLRGPVIAFNLLDSHSHWVGKSEVEKLAIVKGIQFRTGSLCNPGGIATHLNLTAGEMRHNFASGQRCSDDHDVLNDKPTGVIRISFGAMSSLADVEKFVAFIEEFYVDHAAPLLVAKEVQKGRKATIRTRNQNFVVESLSVYPIKSCGAFKIPADKAWELTATGLAWDREWCLIHPGTSAALSQKKYPKMTLLRPSIDVGLRVLKIEHEIEGTAAKTLTLSLDTQYDRLGHVKTCEQTSNRNSSVCGSSVDVQIYTCAVVSKFFTEALGVPCTLARFPRAGPVRRVHPRQPRHTPDLAQDRAAITSQGKSTMLANESPILLVSRSSVNRLNEQIKRNGGVGKAVAADAFRGNIVVAEECIAPPGQKMSRWELEHPYVEDDWSSLRVTPQKNETGSTSDTTDAEGENQDRGLTLEVLGPCQRCQMVCVDQESAKRTQEPFSTLAKTRRKPGMSGVWFGMHLCLADAEADDGKDTMYIRVGDRVVPEYVTSPEVSR